MLHQWILKWKHRGQRASDAHAHLMKRFREKYAGFKSLLESNSELLKMISGMEEMLEGQRAFGMAYIRSQAIRIMFHARRMVTSLEVLSGQPFPALTALLDRIQQVIKEDLEQKPIARIPNLVAPYSVITKEMVDFVGGKNAHLGEIANRVRIPVPDGFAVTTTAFEEFLNTGDLMTELRRRKMALVPTDSRSVQETGAFIRELFLQTPVPAAAAAEIMDAYEAMRRRKKYSGPLFLALRSSAIGEDSDRSFAGQYLTVLNVPPENILDEYRRILASLFTPQAISYRHHMGIPFEDAAMSVACLEMIPSIASGVMYTRHPFNLLENTITINAVRGLGPYAVDGVVTPDVYTLSKSDPPALLEQKISHQPVQLVLKDGGGVMEAPTPEEERGAPHLTREQAETLAGYGLRLESHFQCPQDIEWALDPSGRLVILQSRPLRIECRGACPSDTEKPPGYELLIEGGDIACPGVGCGPAHVLRSEEDLASFPDRGVLVAAHPSPHYVMIMSRARAILTDSGSVTGHMASVAREFGVPAILNLETATTAVPHGETVTVDAHSGRVYRGEVLPLLDMKLDRTAFMKDTPVYKTLRKLADLVIPLHLTDPKSARFSPRGCRTVHDVMRFAHETCYQELFQISDHVTDQARISLRLKAPLPIDLYVIDLGGGLTVPGGRARSVKPEQVCSAPFKALLTGMLADELRSVEPRPVELKGLLSVMTQQMLSPPGATDRRFGDKSYAIISDKYLNFSSRVGYHYSVLDVYCGATPTNNYINFEFKGGAADAVRKNRRVRCIRNILDAIGFLTDVQADRVTARFGKQPAPVIAEKLDILGRLLIFTRQMDMLMQSEASVALATENFLNGKYHF